MNTFTSIQQLNISNLLSTIFLEYQFKQQLTLTEIMTLLNTKLDKKICETDFAPILQWYCLQNLIQFNQCKDMLYVDHPTTNGYLEIKCSQI